MQRTSCNVCRQYRFAWLSLIGILAAGCVPWQQGTPTPAPPIDFAQASERAHVVFDVTNTYEISDEQLNAKYAAEGIEVLVRSTIFPGDTKESRYMYAKDTTAHRQYIYLSGTNSQTMWQFDFDLAAHYEYDFECFLHRGFNNSALTVLDDLQYRLELDYPITIVGYSLGGGMAVILGKYLQINGFMVDSVTTFGQPKVTDAAGKAVFADLPLLRFVNIHDPVPRLPPDGFSAIDTFEHFGNEVILYDGPYFAYIPTDDPVFDCSTDSHLVSILMNLNLSEHSNVYVKRIDAKLSNAIQVPLGPLPP